MGGASSVEEEIVITIGDQTYVRPCLDVDGIKDTGAPFYLTLWRTSRTTLKVFPTRSAKTLEQVKQRANQIPDLKVNKVVTAGGLDVTDDVRNGRPLGSSNPISFHFSYDGPLGSAPVEGPISLETKHQEASTSIIHLENAINAAKAEAKKGIVICNRTIKDADEAKARAQALILIHEQIIATDDLDDLNRLQKAALAMLQKVNVVSTSSQ